MTERTEPHRITTCSDWSVRTGTILAQPRCLDGLRINGHRGSLARCSGIAVEEHPEEIPCNGLSRVRDQSAVALVPQPPITTTQCGPTAGWRLRFLLRRDLVCCPRGLPKVGQIRARSKGARSYGAISERSSNLPYRLVRAFAAVLGTEGVVEGLDTGQPFPAPDVGPGMPPAGDGLIQDQLGSAWFACRWMSSMTRYTSRLSGS